MIDEAIAQASGGGNHRYSLRQLFYQVRPHIIKRLGVEPTYENVANKVITEIEAERGEDLPGIYRDTRGTLYHPHERREIPLGTLEGMAPWPFYHFIDGGMEMGGPMVTASDLIFIAATSDSYFRAFDIDDGAELWKTKLPTTGNAVPMTYRYKGKQYVVIAAGGHFTSPLPAGDHVMAYRLAD